MIGTPFNELNRRRDRRVGQREVAEPSGNCSTSAQMLNRPLAGTSYSFVRVDPPCSR